MNNPTHSDQDSAKANAGYISLAVSSVGFALVAVMFLASVLRIADNETLFKVSLWVFWLVAVPGLLVGMVVFYLKWAWPNKFGPIEW